MILNRFFKPKNTKYYDHFISLGYNCELSFQFFQYHKFTESSLFSWSNVKNIENLINLLGNLDIIGKELSLSKPMWHCSASKTSFHGKIPNKAWKNNQRPSQQEEENDKKDLLNRISYLKNKLIETGNDHKKNLYAFAYDLKENTSGDEALKNINNLFSALKKIMGNDFDLLIVLEKNLHNNIIEEKNSNPKIFIRRVSFFAPEHKVTAKDNDNKSWKKIFKEFQITFKLKTKKKYNFEE